MTISKIGVLGSGQMGAGIAQVAALSGFEVVLHDISEPALEKATSDIARRLDRMVQREKIDVAAREGALSRLSSSASVSSIESCGLVIEAVTENMAVKGEVLAAADRALASGAFLASNTSSISITKLASGTSRAEQFIGMHFMNPVPVMKLVEVIRGLETSDETFQAVKDVSEKMGKTVVCSQDYPGFIVNRILIPMLNEAIFALYEGIATAEDIDAAMKLGTNQPMGPLTLADFIGLDTVLAIAEVLHDGLGDSKYRPCPLLRNYVAAGRLGKKTGRGFFDYS
jgi:3-hydroxybutyryl-CoA dehydrogenase